MSSADAKPKDAPPAYGAADMEELRRKRRISAFRLIAHFILSDDGDVDLYALNLKQDLTDAERTDLLGLILRTFPADQAESLVRECFEGAGMPAPSLTDDVRPDARFWASSANAAELRAYAIACVERMSKRTLEGFKKWVAKQ